MNFTRGLPDFCNKAVLTWYGVEQPDPFRPDVLGLTHRHPDVGVHEVHTGNCLAGVLGDRDLRAGARGDVAGDLDDVVGRCQRGRPGETDVRPQECAGDQQRSAHVEPAVADERVGQGVVRLAARLVHREEVGEHLRRVPLVGESVVDGDAGVLGQHLDVDLTVAAELDGVVHPAEDPRRVGHRLLVAQLRA